MLMPFGKSLYQWIKYFVSQELLIYYVIYFHIIILCFWTVKIILKKFNQTEGMLISIFIFSVSLVYSSLRTPDINHLFFVLSPLIVIFAYYLEKALSQFRNKGRVTAKITYFLAICVISIFFLRLLYINHPQILKIGKVPSAVLSKANSPSYVGD